MQTAICSRATMPTPVPPVVLAFKKDFARRKERGLVLAWPCPYCQTEGHEHEKSGLQTSQCGRGMYVVRWNGGWIW